MRLHCEAEAEKVIDETFYVFNTSVKLTDVPRDGRLRYYVQLLLQKARLLINRGQIKKAKLLTGRIEYFMDEVRKALGYQVSDVSRMALQFSAVLEAVGDLEGACAMDEEAMVDAEKGMHEPAVVVARKAKRLLGQGEKQEAARVLREYFDYFHGELEEGSIKMDAQDNEKHILAPLELLRDILLSEDEGTGPSTSDELGRVQAAIDTVKTASERARVQMLEELRLLARGGKKTTKKMGRKEMLEQVRSLARNRRKATKKGGKKKRKKGKKKKKKGGKRRSQDSTERADGSSGLEGPMANMTLMGDESSEAVKAKEDEDDGPGEGICGICLCDLEDEDDEEEDEDVALACSHHIFHSAEALACSHTFHAVCLDLWASKCQEMNLEEICPICGGPFTRTAHNDGWMFSSRVT